MSFPKQGKTNHSFTGCLAGVGIYGSRGGTLLKDLKKKLFGNIVDRLHACL